MNFDGILPRDNEVVLANGYRWEADGYLNKAEKAVKSPNPERINNTPDECKKTVEEIKKARASFRELMAKGICDGQKEKREISDMINGISKSVSVGVIFGHFKVLDVINSAELRDLPPHEMYEELTKLHKALTSYPLEIGFLETSRALSNTIFVSDPKKPNVSNVIEMMTKQKEKLTLIMVELAKRGQDKLVFDLSEAYKNAAQSFTTFDTDILVKQMEFYINALEEGLKNPSQEQNPLIQLISEKISKLTTQRNNYGIDIKNTFEQHKRSQIQSLDNPNPERINESTQECKQAKEKLEGAYKALGEAYLRLYYEGDSELKVADTMYDISTGIKDAVNIGHFSILDILDSERIQNLTVKQLQEEMAAMRKALKSNQLNIAFSDISTGLSNTIFGSDKKDPNIQADLELLKTIKKDLTLVLYDLARMGEFNLVTTIGEAYKNAAYSYKNYGTTVIMNKFVQAAIETKREVNELIGLPASERFEKVSIIASRFKGMDKDGGNTMFLNYYFDQFEQNSKSSIDNANPERINDPREELERVRPKIGQARRSMQEIYLRLNYESPEKNAADLVGSVARGLKDAVSIGHFKFMDVLSDRGLLEAPIDKLQTEIQGIAKAINSDELKEGLYILTKGFGQVVQVAKTHEEFKELAESVRKAKDIMGLEMLEAAKVENFMVVENLAKSYSNAVEAFVSFGEPSRLKELAKHYDELYKMVF